jgi:hypothetical protein
VELVRFPILCFTRPIRLRSGQAADTPLFHGAAEVRASGNVKINVEGIGQECPIHMIKIPALSLQRTQGRGRGNRFPESLFGMSTKVDSTFVDFTVFRGHAKVG